MNVNQVGNWMIEDISRDTPGKWDPIRGHSSRECPHVCRKAALSRVRCECRQFQSSSVFLLLFLSLSRYRRISNRYRYKIFSWEIDFFSGYIVSSSGSDVVVIAFFSVYIHVSFVVFLALKWLMMLRCAHSVPFPSSSSSSICICICNCVFCWEF